MGRRQHKCRVCDEPFGRKDTCPRHEDTVHGTAGLVACPDCQRLYRPDYLRTRHSLSCTVAQHQDIVLIQADGASDHPALTGHVLSEEFWIYDGDYSWGMSRDEHTTVTESGGSDMPHISELGFRALFPVKRLLK